MLVLTRRAGERLLIGDRITVTVVSVDRGKVRLGIEAPPDVLVLREELTAQPAAAVPAVVAAVPPKG
jgi:carbon storage regulator